MTTSVQTDPEVKQTKAFRDAIPSWNPPEQLDTRGQKRPQTAPHKGSPVLMKGNEAVVYGALLAGCRCFFGYPITPASEIAHTAAALFPMAGAVFLQAESEIAAIQMVYGAASTGIRSMTASSSPGISLKQEGISYAAGAELPMVIVDIMRGGPGLGSIAPEQGDYFQMVKGGGHGNYHMVVLAPNSAQEMCNLTMSAFEIADKYRNPTVVLTDGLVGQMKEPVHLPDAVRELPETKEWSVQGTAETRENLVCSIHLDPQDLEDHVRKLHEKAKLMTVEELRWEEYRTEDAEIILVGYGVVSRILQGAVDAAREKGLKVGLLRPITLWPYPSEPLRAVCSRAKLCVAVELSTGQMVEDVRLAVSDLVPIDFMGRAGGVLPSADEVLEQLELMMAEHGVEATR